MTELTILTETVITVGDFEFRSARLSDGQLVVDEEDIARFLASDPSVQDMKALGEALQPRH